MSEQTDKWRLITCYPANLHGELQEACDLIDQLEARLAAAEVVCCFFGAWNLGAEVTPQLMAAYESWKATRPK